MKKIMQIIFYEQAYTSDALSRCPPFVFSELSLAPFGERLAGP
jgi:hypothetical protein